MRSSYQFDPSRYEGELRAILAEVDACEVVEPKTLGRILRLHPKDGRSFFSKSELLRGYRYLRDRDRIARERASREECRARASLPADERVLTAKLRMKPVRTQSGVAPVTALTKPFPCPGRCIFCPSDVRMPKSYLSDEPGAQRAAEHQFDPYRQTLSRLLSFHNTGHRVDKVELIILGGTWSFYPESYQLWFIKRCFDALNDFSEGRSLEGSEGWEERPPSVDWRELEDRVDGRAIERSYNRVIEDHRQKVGASSKESGEVATWKELAEIQRRNETSSARCVGLVVETRPDRIDEAEVTRIRRLGATKVQIGYQSLNDAVLEQNRRGHDVAATRRAMRLLRQAGFKIHAHWMPNLYGSSPAQDIEDFGRLFGEPDFRPDELKIYPCSLIESAELMAYFEDGRFRPYDHQELLEVLTRCLPQVPPYCRVTRVIRDIPGTDIVEGNKVTNFRQVAEQELKRQGARCRDIRAREIGNRATSFEELELSVIEYQVATGSEHFLQYTTPDDRLAAFLRLLLPREASFLEELHGCAVIREVHVYGAVVGIGARDSGKAQHLGLGRRLIERAASIAGRRGFDDLAVISSVGTRPYYRRLGFVDGELYQHRSLGKHPQKTSQSSVASVATA